MSEERFSEDKLATQLGVPRKDLRGVRKVAMTEHVDWEKIDGEIYYTLTGLHLLKGFYDVPLVTVTSIQADLPKNGRVKMTVVDIPMNPRTVLAEDEQGARSVVFVGRNATFARGDKIEVGPYEGQQDVFQLLSAIPRDKRRSPPPEHPI
jgi:hypothetical protein